MLSLLLNVERVSGGRDTCANISSVTFPSSSPGTEQAACLSVRQLEGHQGADFFWGSDKRRAVTRDLCHMTAIVASSNKDISH